MSSPSKHPTLQGLDSTPRGRKRLIKYGAAFLVLGALLSIIGFAGFTIYKNQEALVFQKRGSEFYMGGYFEDAEDQLATANRQGKPNAKTLFLLAKSRAALGKLSPALSALRRAVELEPDNDEIRFVLANIAASNGRSLEAIDELQKLLDRKPNYTAARLLLIQELTKTNQPKAAADQYQVLAGQDLPDKQLSEIQLGLARLWIEQNRTIRAQRLLQTALSLNKNNEEAKQLLTALGQDEAYRRRLADAESTDTIDSRITSPEAGSKISDKTIEVRGTAVAGSAAIVQVEVTYDDGRTWHMARPINGVYDQWVAKVKFPKANKRYFLLYSRAIGSAGVPERSKNWILVNVDNTGPAVIRQLEPAKPNLSGGRYKVPPKINLAALEGDALIFYRWNNDDYQVYVSALTAPAGKNRLSYFTRDAEGHEGPLETLVVKVKK